MRHMSEAEIKERIKQGRDFVKPVDFGEEDDDYQSDQDLKKRQPPLVKEAQPNTEKISLPIEYDSLTIESDFLKIINERSSHRIYTNRKMTLLELSYLLWCTQGVKDIRGRKYATIRTVPCGGARHEFETYMVIRNVDGLENGFYHYLPMNHSLELLEAMSDEEQIKEFINRSVLEQRWACMAGVVFYYSFVAYRAEWRYGIDAHRIVLIDAGHITENLYLAAQSIGLGGCAVGAVNGKLCDRTFKLDGDEEYIFYAMPVGTVDIKDKEAEDDIYAFVREQGL